MIPLSYRLLGTLALVLGLFASGYFYGRHAEGIKQKAIINKMELARAAEIQAAQAEIIKAQSANDALKTKLGVQHAQANNALNTLLDNPAGRVQLPSTCLPASASGEAHSPSGSAVSTTSPERTADTAQEALDGFRRSLEADAAEWSRALNACAVVMDWAKNQQ